MRVFFLLCFVLSIICSVAQSQTVVDTYIKGKASDTKVTCLMTVLAKINDDDPIVTDQPDFSKKIKEGVQQGIDMNTLLLQYQYFKKQERDDIASCGLNMTRAMARCQAVYGECEEIMYGTVIGSDDQVFANERLPFVSRKCPEGYIRYGCCKCQRRCEDYKGIFEITNVKDKHNYCIKKQAIVSQLSDDYQEGFEPFADKFVKRCRPGWARVGYRLCVPKCPLGWPDHGDRCMKTGEINLMPFVWQPGDENERRL